ncbi:MAG: NAD-dependent epimerase/dehydratase family protein [Chloroflexi bacterium]|nr:NAD-dependent epimerase/dehydratase family protein [Chloroflexota bacterium]
METETELEALLTRPSPALIQSLSSLRGDLAILGVAGKMGPTLAILARRALEAAGNPARVIGVSRFSSPAARTALEQAGVETVACDLLERRAVERLPDVANVIYMAGRKFGSTGSEELTWAMNTYAPALVAERYSSARVVAFSTGNVYSLTPVALGGATEEGPLGPVGEYAQSCLGRERVLTYFSQRNATPMTLLRLNYAVELRYGILLDIAHKVAAGAPIDLTMGSVNVIWQGDANSAALRSLALAASPPTVLNITGPETLSVRSAAVQLGELLGVEPRFEGSEAPTALLNNATRAHAALGYPSVPLATLLRWVAGWVRIGGPTLNKPTHYEQRDGRF